MLQAQAKSEYKYGNPELATGICILFSISILANLPAGRQVIKLANLPYLPTLL
jgi:hypothetical protein